MGDEETVRDRLELEKEKEEREEMRNEGEEANRNSFLHFDAWIPLSNGDLSFVVQFQKGCKLLFGGLARVWD